jgi:hypothetical protein
MEGVVFDEQGRINLQIYVWDAPPPYLWGEPMDAF